MAINTSAIISQRTNAYADLRLLKRAVTNNVLGQFGQVRPIPKNKTATIKFRRYEKLAANTAPLKEGVTPAGNTVTTTDKTAILHQYGDFVRFSDYLMDTHEDPLLNEFMDMLGEQAAESIDQIRAGVLKAGSVVHYANGTERLHVNTPISLADLAAVERALRAQEAKELTSIIKGSVRVGTAPIRASFIAVCDSDLQYDLEQLSGWTPVANYPAQMGIINGEVGSVGSFRFVFDNNLSAWADGGASTATMISTSGSNADVYPILVFAKDAYGITPLGGKDSVKTGIVNPTITETDPLGQRGIASWKTWQSVVRLNENWMARIEVAATDL